MARARARIFSLYSPTTINIRTNIVGIGMKSNIRDITAASSIYLRDRSCKPVRLNRLLILERRIRAWSG